MQKQIQYVGCFIMKNQFQMLIMIFDISIQIFPHTTRILALNRYEFTKPNLSLKS